MRMETVHRLSRSVLICAVLFPSTLIMSCGSAVDSVKNVEKDYIVRNLGPAVNSSYDEVAPLPAVDGSVVRFTSNRPSGPEGSETDRIFGVVALGGAFSDPKTVAVSPGDGMREGAMSAETKDGIVAFARCFAAGGVGDCDIWFARESGPEFVDAVNPGYPLNSPDWDSHPALTLDGTVLVFASERHGGRGNSDLWISRRGAGGTWGIPVNMGGTINTAGDEKSPFLPPSGDTLYFASDYHGGYGGFDIFRSIRNGASWSKPLNVGRPLNSAEDDLFMSRTRSGDRIYFSSKRAGTSGGFDLYIATRAETTPSAPVEERRDLIVQYTAKNAWTLDPVPARITYASQFGDEIDLNAGGDGRARSPVRGGIQYAVSASCAGFMAAVDSFMYPLAADGLRERTILLTPVLERERKLYSFVVEFDFSLFNIRPEEKKNLDSVVTLLARYPNSTVVVSGHTDSVGTDAYNIRLGYNRAREVSSYVERYLLEKIAALRRDIEVRTYGEAEPAASNATEEGRQRNRRVEIAIYRNE